MGLRTGDTIENLDAKLNKWGHLIRRIGNKITAAQAHEHSAVFHVIIHLRARF